jgi:exopolysaccharide biosynthesis polyprenyl glycosylphosphotransferase
MQKRGKRDWDVRGLHFVSDVAAVVAAYYIALYVRFDWTLGIRVFATINRAFSVRNTGEVGDVLETFYRMNSPRIILILVVVLCTLYGLMELYSGCRFLRRRLTGWHVLLANVIAISLFFAYFYLRRNTWHPRSVFGTILFFNVMCCVVFRAFLDRLLNGLRKCNLVDSCRAVLMGEGDRADELWEYISTVKPHGIEVEARVTREAEETVESYLGRTVSALYATEADMLICADEDADISDIMLLLERVEELDIPVKVLSDKMSVLTDQASLSADRIRGVPLVHFESPAFGERFVAIRHGGARMLAGLIGVLFSPLMGLIALSVRLTSHGPVLFKQERMGLNREPFMMFKFRTMVQGAHENQDDVEAMNESGMALFKIRNDPRVTRAGRFLRRFSLDELPQLWNVVKGDMVLVGPRPLPRRDFERYCEDWHYSRHGGMPGLTCLWQVSGRSDVDFHNMCILDIYYLRNQGWLLDLKLILRTFWVVLFAKGAY